jgi:hypothetical protein
MQVGPPCKDCNKTAHGGSSSLQQGLDSYNCVINMPELHEYCKEQQPTLHVDCVGRECDSSLKASTHTHTFTHTCTHTHTLTHTHSHTHIHTRAYLQDEVLGVQPLWHFSIHHKAHGGRHLRVFKVGSTLIGVRREVVGR